MNWPDLLQAERAKCDGMNLAIQEVSIHHLWDNRHVKYGCIVPENRNESLFVTVEIGSAVQPDLKISALYHEVGHARFYLWNESIILSHGFRPDHEFQVSSEFEAFTNQLTQVLQLHSRGLPGPLEKSYSDLWSRQNQADCVYREAVKRILKTPLWQECVRIIEKGSPP